MMITDNIRSFLHLTLEDIYIKWDFQEQKSKIKEGLLVVRTFPSLKISSWNLSLISLSMKTVIIQICFCFCFCFFFVFCFFFQSSSENNKYEQNNVSKWQVIYCRVIIDSFAKYVLLHHLKYHFHLPPLRLDKQPHCTLGMILNMFHRIKRKKILQKN